MTTATVSTDLTDPAPSAASAAARWGVLAYGALAYAMFLGVFLYAVCFIIGFAVPVTLDTMPGGDPLAALLTNAGLLGLFALQHSLMARPAFKRAITRVIPQPAERSTYVLCTNIALLAMFFFWQPMGGVIWDAQHPALRVVLDALGVAGWGIVLLATFLINHFDLFGLRQVWLCFRNKPYTPPVFGTPMLYRIVRHPLYVGWLMAFWFTPTMTAAHLVFAIATTVYILVAIQLEERDLVAEHGEKYIAYRERVPMLVPFLKAKPGREAA